jgi:aminoglycoside phosphotransferase (APT) family kinase protein
MSEPLPTEQLARDLVTRHFGWEPTSIRRFTSGLAFFVYDVVGEGGNLAVRLGRPSQADALAQGLALATRLRPLGVPVPATLASGSEHGFPFVVQERLPGTDLGNVMRDLDRASLDRIAHAVADAQLATTSLGAGTRYGYAATAETAPHARWTGVVAAHIARSERRIRANGFFPAEVITTIQALFARHAEALDRIPATPFLHDTTTKNVIVTPSGEFSGIVDVDDLCFGDPRYAPALTRVAMLVHGGPIDYVTTWMARAGLPQDGLFEFYVAVFLLDFMSEHGTVFNGNEAPSDPEGREKLLRLFAEATRG